MIQIDKLRELSLQGTHTELEQRTLIMYFIYYNTQLWIKECITAPLGDTENFKKNFEVSRAYFGSFVTK